MRFTWFCLAVSLLTPSSAFADAKCGSSHDVVRALYTALLARDPDPSGLDFHSKKLLSGRSVRRVALEIALDPSGEVKKRLTEGKDARQTVELAYESFLGRPIAPGEEGNIEGYKQDGVKAYELMIYAIFHSLEYQRNFGEDTAPHDRRTLGVKYCGGP